MIRFFIFSLSMLIAADSIAQQLPPEGSPSVSKPAEKHTKQKTAKTDNPSKLSVTGGLGAASYVGDLVKNSTAFNQLSYASSLGLSYSIISHLNARFDIGLNQVQGYDSKKGGAYPERNLSFKSKILEFSLAAEYTVLDMNKH